MQRLIGTAVLFMGVMSTATHAAEPAAPASTLTIGGGIAVVPEYAGADKGRVVPIIAVDYQHESGFFASTQRGLGYQTKFGGFGLSAAIGYEGGRSDRDRGIRSGSDDLKGMGEIKGGATANLGANYALKNGMTFGVQAKLAMANRDRGNSYDFGIQAPLLISETDKVAVFSMATYSDSKHMQTFHGVTAAQSAASGFRKYTPEAGFSKIGWGVNWTRKLNKDWSINSTAGLFTMVGDAADSPLTKRKTAPLIATTINYAF